MIHRRNCQPRCCTLVPITGNYSYNYTLTARRHTRPCYGLLLLSLATRPLSPPPKLTADLPSTHAVRQWTVTRAATCHVSRFGDFEWHSIDSARVNV